MTLPLKTPYCESLPPEYCECQGYSTAHAVLEQIAVLLNSSLLPESRAPPANRLRFPLVIEGLGWLSANAAFSLASMEHHNFRRLIAWPGKIQGRVSGILAVAFGAFLVYAYV